jgi:prepilin-type N-terminal cleavage/methylation domain-containing protein
MGTTTMCSVVMRRRATSGFTLVEILIVISIISVLAGMVLVGVQHARTAANGALVKTTVSDMTNAVERYVQDEGEYPGMELDADAERNDFPILYTALFGEPRPRGKGGRSAPYTNPNEDNIAVYDESLSDYRTPDNAELYDEDVAKFIRDPWGEPYVYRANKGKRRADHDFMHNPTVDIYSKGPDGIDQTALGESADGENDDIGNW